ncbi:MBL fold metallo-hydrolase [Hymenobacter sp.]|uniref:MBL fold metallo-hydrolase n=1 Tax=Hymenobacter sp. TaxID=1898978 RepID=UPI00286AD622|nr:MBL fold metallo-hydrolase [Hymenobacter sp.]
MTTVHMYTGSEAGLSVNAYLVETPHGVVAVDATLTQSDSRALRARADHLGKPLLAVLLTHGHPDHVAGVTNLVAGLDVPVVALASVRDLMARTEAAKHAQWAGMFGAEWIPAWTYPTQLVHDQEVLEFDGVTFRVHDLGAGGDCDANAIWVLESEQPPVAFVGDLLFNGYHTYMADGAVLRWRANLTQFRPLLAGMARLYVGHGPAGDARLVDQQLAYFDHYCAALLEITRGGGQLDEAATAELTARLTRAYPDYGLQFMVGLSAPRVAVELAAVAP